MFGLLEAARANVRIQLADQAMIMRAAEHMKGDDFRDFTTKLTAAHGNGASGAGNKPISEAKARYLNAFLKNIPAMNKRGGGKQQPGAR